MKVKVKKERNSRITSYEPVPEVRLQSRHDSLLARLKPHFQVTFVIQAFVCLFFSVFFLSFVV